MTLYFIDGRVDCFETSVDYPELEDANIIDAADGVRECFDQLNDLEIEAEYRRKYVVISNFLPFLDQADEVYLYNPENKTFNKWDFQCFRHPNFYSKAATYQANLYEDWTEEE